MVELIHANSTWTWWPVPLGCSLSILLAFPLFAKDSFRDCFWETLMVASLPWVGWFMFGITAG